MYPIHSKNFYVSDLTKQLEDKEEHKFDTNESTISYSTHGSQWNLGQGSDDEQNTTGELKLVFDIYIIIIYQNRLDKEFDSLLT